MFLCCFIFSIIYAAISNKLVCVWQRWTSNSLDEIPLARMKAAVSMASSTRLRSFSAFSSHCFFSSSKCSTDAWLLGFIRTIRAAFTTCGTKSAAYRSTVAHTTVIIYIYIYIFIHQMMVATIKNNKKKKTENLTKLNYNNYIYARRPLLIYDDSVLTVKPCNLTKKFCCSTGN